MDREQKAHFIDNSNDNKDKGYKRWIALTIASLGMFSAGYCWDNVVALQNEFQDIYHIDNIQYNLLYSVLTFPNIIMCVVSGILTDYIGVNFTVLLFFSMVAIGHGIFVIGCWSHKYLLMLAGRFLYGMGYESYFAAITAFIYEYFHHKELGLAMAVLGSLDVIGASINDVTTYYIYIHTNSIVFAVSVGFVLLTTSLIVLFIFVCHRIRTTRTIKQDIKTINEPETSDKFKLSDIKQFGVLYWILTMYIGVNFGLVLSWMNIGTDFLQKTYGYDHKKANILLMIPYIISGPTSPMFGFISDRFGKKTYLLLLVSVILVLTHLLFGRIHEVTPIVALCGMGFSYSIFGAVIWSSVAQIVDERYIGTAYGIPLGFYSLLASIDFIAVGALTSDVDNTMKYANVEWFLFGWSCVSSVLALTMIYFDKRTGGRLNEPTIKE